MRLERSEEIMVVEDRPRKIWAACVTASVVGLILIPLPWMIDAGMEGKKVLAAKALVSLIGMAMVAASGYVFRMHPATTAELDRSEMKLSLRRDGIARLRREVPFSKIEMVTVGQKEDAHGGIIYRLGIGTRSGERLPLTRWMPDPGNLHEVARQIEQWIRP
jgi:hypothetical protein